MIVYRVAKQSARFSHEASGGWHGPFAVWGTHSYACNIDPPEPMHDGLGRYTAPGEVCGAISLEQMRVWFEEATGELHEAGFRLLEIDVPDEKVHVLKHQVVFDWVYAVIVNEHPVSHILERELTPA